MKLTAKYIKGCLLKYYRFTRGFIAGTEVYVPNGKADVIAINEKYAIEIEIKINKYDLRNDIKKSKHSLYKRKTGHLKPTMFYYCVPTNLIEETEKLINKTNKKYGIIVFNENEFNSLKIYEKKHSENLLYIHKRASKLCNLKYDKWMYVLSKRLSSEIITMYDKLLWGKNDRL